jgi:hypothetical protein
MMEEDDNAQPTMQSSPFDAIRKIDEQGREYWNARDLAKLWVTGNIPTSQGLFARRR